MCGIVGYIGNKDSEKFIIEGLSRLEYRGYDSAGISLYNEEEDKLETYKAVGKIKNLTEQLEKSEIEKSLMGIGHTRWATHGVVNEVNAHPHGDSDICIVHNGIIENAYDLREELKAKGCDFKSETDTEVFYHLVKLLKEKEEDLKKVIAKAFEKIEGNSAFVILDKKFKKIFSIKRSAPLVCAKRIATGQKDLFVSSDPYALLGFADTMFFPEDEVIAELDYESNYINFYELDGSESFRFRLDKKSMELNVEKKGDFEHFMLKEIYEQPYLVKSILRNYRDESVQKKLTKLSEQTQFNFLNIIGCGTAWHAGLVLKNAFEKNLAMKVNCEVASEFRYRGFNVLEKEAALFISQSGETADTLACAELFNSKQKQILSILNVEGSSIYRMCRDNFLIYAGQEIGVASTKAFTMQVIVGHFVMKALQKLDSLNYYEKELILLSEKIEAILEDTSLIEHIAKDIYQKKGFIFTGRGKYYPIALEGALKLKEIAYVHAEGYAAGELKHGPIALIDDEMVNISIIGPELYEKTLSNTEEIRARRGKICIVGPKDKKELKEVADWYIPLDYEGLDDFSPLYVNVIMQLLSYYIAKEKGTDIDKPRNLAKSVTVE